MCAAVRRSRDGLINTVSRGGWFSVSHYFAVPRVTREGLMFPARRVVNDLKSAACRSSPAGSGHVKASLYPSDPGRRLEPRTGTHTPNRLPEQEGVFGLLN